MAYELIGSDSPADKTAEENRTAYLRGLKKSDAGDKPEAAVPARVGKERRRSIRYRCDGSAELRLQTSEVKTWGTLADVSMHGCYIEMKSTYPVGTALELQLEAVGVRVQAQGEVRVSYPFLGIGVCFRDLAVGEKERLRELLQRLSTQDRTIQPEANAIGSNGMPINLLTPAHASKLLEELRQFFESHSSISREEFLQMRARHTKTP